MFVLSTNRTNFTNEKTMKMLFFDHSDNADISMASVVGWCFLLRFMSYGGTSLRRLRNRYPGDSFFGGNTIREGVFTIHLLDGAGAPSYFFP